jgi:predicted transcriptional regulator
VAEQAIQVVLQKLAVMVFRELVEEAPLDMETLGQQLHLVATEARVLSS